MRNRVSYTAVRDLETDRGWRAATYYSYDVHGNVDTLIQDFGNSTVYPNSMNSVNGNPSGNRWKKIVYRYDLISGKVNYVIYQPDSADAFYHHYLYDAENRITIAQTSRDRIYWETDAQYQYYKHGPLARTVIGQQQVQGLDYIYTLQGWLKAINASYPLLGGSDGNGDGCGTGTAVNDLVVNARAENTPDAYAARQTISFEEGFENGNDDYFDAIIDENLTECERSGDSYNTTDGTTESVVAKDAYNIVLNYYNNDYKGITAPSPSATIPGQLGSDFRPLYNGNISSMAVNIDKLQNALVYNYQYDQLNRLVQMDAWQSTNKNWSQLTKLADFGETISYDPNGNILSYNRNGNSTFAGKPLAMDNLTYNYTVNTNKLNYIHDGVPDANYTQDLDDQTTNNYDYDDIGNLIKDNKEGITNIEWTVYGKINKITKSDGSVIAYTYDASGNRISKAVTKNSVTTSTWYVRDASGNVMSVYVAGIDSVNSGHLTQSEIHLYGSSRLGILKDSTDMQTTPSHEIATLDDGSKAYSYNFTRGYKSLN